jgi:hypothetical protein
MPSGHGLEGVDNPPANMCYLQKLPIPSEEIVRGLPITSDTLTHLPEGCQFPLSLCKKFARELPTAYGTFARGLFQLHTKGQPLCNTSKESKIHS